MQVHTTGGSLSNFQAATADVFALWRVYGHHADCSINPFSCAHTDTHILSLSGPFVPFPFLINKYLFLNPFVYTCDEKTESSLARARVTLKIKKSRCFIKDYFFTTDGRNHRVQWAWIRNMVFFLLLVFLSLLLSLPLPLFLSLSHTIPFSLLFGCGCMFLRTWNGCATEGCKSVYYFRLVFGWGLGLRSLFPSSSFYF